MSKPIGTYQEYCTTIVQYSSCMDDYPYVIDLTDDKYYISEKVLGRFRIHSNEFTHAVEGHREFVWPDDYEMLRADVQAIMNGEKDSHDIRYRWISKAGSPIWIHCKGHVIKDEDGVPRFMVGCVNEIGERQVADNITGLRQTKELVEELNAGNFPKGFFMRLGLDGFKNVVERLGMEYGDQVLRQVADCIRKCLAPGQRLFRAISDEFMIIDFEGRGRNDALRLYRKIRATIDFYIEANDYKSVFTISAGAISTSEIENQNHDEVMKMSRFTLNMAKNRGRNQIYFFNPDEYVDFLWRRDINLALRQAVSREFEGFELYYQPITYSTDGRLYAAESLCRFFMNGKMISPVDFIPILEESGLIIPVGRWIMREAVAMVKECRKYNPEFRLSINLSYVQVLKTGITDDLTRFLTQYDVDPSAIIVEMTESGYLEGTPTIEFIWNHLRDHGIRIAVDDFGTGYSNMRYLDRLRPNVIKIDRSFTVEALEREYAFLLLENIVRMAHSMNLQVCIEGIETGEELQMIQQISPDYIQGYYYGKPCSRENFIEQYMKKELLHNA